MAAYAFTTIWRFDAPLEDVWEAMSHPENWPRWWHGLEDVVELERGSDSGIGNVRRYIWRGTIPYRLVTDILTTRIEHGRLIAGTASGDLEGVGTWRFGDREGFTLVTYDWRVVTTKCWMNVLEPFARPLFHWNHDRLMEHGRVGLAEYLRARAGAAEASRATA